MSDQPVIIAELTPEPVVVAEVSPLPEVIAEVGALYAPPGPFVSYRPEQSLATEDFPDTWVIDVGITGKTYVTPDFAAADDFSLQYRIPADGVGSFRSVIMPQTGAGLPSSGIGIFTGVTSLTTTVSGNSFPLSLANGTELFFSNDGEDGGWKVVCSKYTPKDVDFEFATAVSGLRSRMYVGVAHNGGGTVDYIDQSRSGDDPGYYMATDNAEPILPSGTAFPTGGAAMIALRNQAAGDGEGITGFYHARRMPVGLTFTITTPLGDITVTPANYGSPAPVAGDVCLINGMTVDGQWQDSNIQGGEDVAVGNTMTWRTTGTGMFTDFEDISPGAGGDVVGPASATNNAFAVYDGTTGKLLKNGVVPGDAAAKNTGTGSGDVAAGNHTHTGPVVGGQDEGTAITNTTTPTSLLDSTISVTATAGQMVQVQGSVAYVNNSGTTRAPTMALKLGSTTVLTLTHQTIQASASTRAMPFNFTIRVEANSDINASGQTVSFNASGVGVVSSGRGTATEAIQSGVALDLVWTHPTTDATQTATLDYVVVTRMGGAGSIS